MVELLNDVPSHVAAYKASGKVTPDEYEQVVMRKIDDVAQSHGTINFLVQLETGMENYALGALLDYLKISFKHVHRWNRMAIVSDQNAVRFFYNALSPLVPGKIVGFELKDVEKAKSWVSEPELTDKNFIQSELKAGVLAGIVGTTLMTLFSYGLSKFQQKNFKEPQLLDYQFRGFVPFAPAITTRTSGWMAHYLTGTSWALLYGPLRSRTRPVVSASAFGLVSGLTGIAMWKELFAASPKKDPAYKNSHYTHLILAHLVFGAAVHTVYSLHSKKTKVRNSR